MTGPQSKADTTRVILTLLFERLFEPCYRLIVVMLQPLDLVWKSINRS